MAFLEVKNLRVNVENKEILKGISLSIDKNEVVALMGPNGSGKSTLSYVIMGHPNYQVLSGEILLDGKNVLDMSPDERARAGLFLSFQYPVEIPGVTMSNFLRTALNALRGKPIPVPEFMKLLKEKLAMLKMDASFATRYLNQGFSGGEKKRAEILQLAVLQPKIAILDETDSGLDIDALRIVAEGINALRGPERGILLITHYQRILNYVKPDFVHVMMDGKIVLSGGDQLAHELEAKGYDWVKEKVIT